MTIPLRFRIVGLAVTFSFLGCATVVPTDKTTPVPLQPPPDPHDNHTVALINGTPLTWREVAEFAMQSNGPYLIEQYIYHRLRHDVAHQHGITTESDELRTRAQAIVDHARRTQGTERVEAALREQGLTEAEYVERFAADPLLAERLLTEKLVAYSLLSHPSADVDGAVFSDLQQAEEFVARLRAGATFDQGLEPLQAASKDHFSRWPRQRLTRGYLPPPLAHLETAWSTFTPGHIVGPDATSNKHFRVLQIAAMHPSNPTPYKEVRDQILRHVLDSPPTDELIRRWKTSLFQENQVYYEKPLRPREEFP